MKKAFTLIELLVVIAIIAILAAILFPVFAQAKLAAKKTSDLSNIDQLVKGTLIYMNDYDDNFPTWCSSLCNAGRVTNPLDPNDTPGGTTGIGRRPMWQYEIYPYVKSWDMYFSPSDHRPTNLVARYYNLSYGYNYGYLSTLNVSGNTACPGETGQWFSSISSTSVDQPANIVAFADNGGALAFGESGSTLGDIVNPPDAWPSTQYFYGPTEVGWGLNCKDYFQGTTVGDTDGFSPRYTGGGNLSFTDGHAKFNKTSQAAIGTNYNPQVSCEATKVTDKTKYMWDPRGASAPTE